MTGDRVFVILLHCELPSLERNANIAQTMAFLTATPSRAIVASRTRTSISARKARVVRTSNNAGQARMVTAETARIAVAAYGVIVAGGGLGAFLKSGSKMSAISGVTAGALLAFAYVKSSVPIALGTAAALSAVFAIRLAKTKKFMPSGMLMTLSVAFAIFFAYTLYA